MRLSEKRESKLKSTLFGSNSKVFDNTLFRVLEWKRYLNNFQEHEFLRHLKFAPFSPLLRSWKEKGGIFKHRKKSCSWKLFQHLFPYNSIKMTKFPIHFDNLVWISLSFKKTKTNSNCESFFKNDAHWAWSMQINKLHKQHWQMSLSPDGLSFRSFPLARANDTAFFSVLARFARPQIN